MAQTTRQQIQTMFDLIETLKERKYLPGESKISDDRITDALRTMVEPNGLMDATIAKVLRPDMSGEEFEAVAMLDEEASYGLFDTYRAIMMPSDYDVSHAIACAFKQDIPRLFSDFALQIHPTSDRAGAYRIAATVSYMERGSCGQMQAFRRPAVPGQTRGRDAEEPVGRTDPWHRAGADGRRGRHRGRTRTRPGPKGTDGRRRRTRRGSHEPRRSALTGKGLSQDGRDRRMDRRSDSHKAGARTGRAKAVSR
ncbi:hypothetical protein [Bifidobacterium sp.]|uniref:hypothetical protein n=1 Tax=Bifidobacterium sp. TaxID=41200 RepID=UPI00257A2FFC|nr:hypothetical protein [Bifidobacterium sp.]